jgi:HK97 family phage major capsid protein
MPDLLLREAKIETESAKSDEAGDYIVRMAFASEEPYERWWGVEVLDCQEKSVRLDRLNDGAPMLYNHNWDELRGVHVKGTVRCEPDKVLRGDIRLTSATEVGRETIALVKSNVLTKTSVGYMIHAVIEQTTTKAGKSIERTLDGRAFQGILKRTGKQTEGGDVAAFRRALDEEFGAFERAEDAPTIYRVVDWEPLENSLVTVPADNTVGVGRHLEKDATDQNQDAKPAAAEPDTTKSIKEPQMPVEKTAEQIEQERAAAQAESVKTEQIRVNEILKVGQAHADVGGVDLAMKAVAENTTVQDFQTKILEARSKKQAEPLKFGEGSRSKENLEDDKKLGFKSMGDFTADVIKASLGKGTSDRLTKAASVYGNEGSGPDGGYAVPPQFASDIASLSFQEDSLLGLSDNTPVSGNTMTFPKDETTPWGSTGITATWEGEGAQSTPKKPALGESSLKLRKLKVLVAASDELLADAAGMSNYLTRKMGEATLWKTNDAIVNGNGSGMPLGILNGGSVVSQAKESGQAADSIVAANIAKMYSRVIKGPGNLVWLLNPDAFPQIITLTLNNNPIWVPNNQGFKDAPDGLLLGRPVILTDACDTVGDVGDIILANMGGYRAITKAGGAQFDTSMHLWFDQDLMAFRLIVRMDGQPALSAPVTPPNSSVTRSHFVTLAART